MQLNEIKFEHALLDDAFRLMEVQQLCFREDYDKDKRAIEKLARKLGDGIIKDDFCPAGIKWRDPCTRTNCAECWREWAYEEDKK